MLIYEIIVTPYYVIYYNIMVNIPMYYSNSIIVNIYWHCRKLVYKIIVNRGGYKITYFVTSYIILHHKSKLTWKNTEYYWTTFSISQYYTQHLENTKQYWNVSTKSYWILFQYNSLV
jgi:hypothetical protein